MSAKFCSRCANAKPLTEFYKRAASYDGLQPVCKDCDNEMRRDRYYGNHERELEYRNQYQRSAHGYERHLAANRNWRRRNKTKQRAHAAVAYAIRVGKLERKPCEECGAQPTEAHHDDYSKPLEIRWLCKRCHDEHHRNAA